jgi:drug/metabolite transporter (DMT)-like permease
VTTSAEPRAPAWLPAAPFVFLFLWSGGFAFAKLGLPHTEPLTFLALRFVCALAVLVAVAAAVRPARPESGVVWLHLVVVGALIQVLYFGGSYIAFDLGASAGGLALIVSLQPILVGLLAPGVAGERVAARQWLGLALGLAGAVVVIAARSSMEAESASAIVAGVIALAAMTAATLYEKRFGSRGVHPVTANLVQYAVGLAFLAPAAAVHESLRVDWTPGFAVSLAYLVVGNSLVSITLLLAMVRHGEAARVSALFFLVPPVAALIAWVVTGERMPLLAWPGLALAAAGVALATRTRRR